MTETAVGAVSAPDGDGVDENLLREAAEGLGTSERDETINAALLEVVVDRRNRRLRAFDNLQQIADEGGIHLDKLDELDQ